ncbi:hypothetical protein SKAU_G00391070 [Synaphobranchus kaupii]|uniref:Mitochondrial antiviral-signaling protein n=1 Tax=Synaphobranchus kaupii TaxID=118154 RepID=A0A9Q1EBM7_SYNKA|nr:hypothetical protein SKAU_G00391070 [Synaphobranchus kaupii]
MRHKTFDERNMQATRKGKVTTKLALQPQISSLTLKRLKMTYASDRLYDGYLRRNMATFVSTVKVTEIIPHLPCLTQSDREEIVAKRESAGNYIAMQMLLDYLKRRQNWVDEFIRALEQCEHSRLASEIRAEHESLLGPRNAAPVAPRVNVHPRHNPDPSPPNHPDPSPNPVLAPLPNPEVGVPLPQPDPQAVAISSEHNLTPASTEASGIAEPSQNPAAPSGQVLPGASSQVPASGYSSLSSSLPPASETPTFCPAVSPPEPQVSSVIPPVQDSNPPADNAIQQPVENSEPTINQVSANDWQAQPVQGSSAQQHSGLARLTAGADHTDSRAASPPVGGPVSEDAFLSKPGTLHSFSAAVHRPSENPAVLAPVAEELYSGDTDRLQISESCRESRASSGTNMPSHNEPEEDHYESTNRSLLSYQDVRVHVGHVSQDASFQNHAGQAFHAPNEQPALGPTHNDCPPGSEAEQAITGPSCPGQQQSNLQRDQRAVSSYNLLANYYIPAAAIAGLSALVMFWKLRN